MVKRVKDEFSPFVDMQTDEIRGLLQYRFATKSGKREKLCFRGAIFYASTPAA